MPYGSKAAHTDYYLLGVQQEPCKKAFWRGNEEKKKREEKKKTKKKKKKNEKKKKGQNRRMDDWKKNKKTERARGLRRKTREEIGQGNHMTVLRFQTGGNIRHPWPSFGGITQRRTK